MGRLKWLVFLLFCIQSAQALDILGQLQDKIDRIKSPANKEFADFLVKLDYTSLFTNYSGGNSSDNSTDTPGAIPIGELSPKCFTDIQHIQNAIVNMIEKKRDAFAEKVMPGLIDSSGKPMAGVLTGHTTFIGLSSECDKISYEYSDTARVFKAQYVRVVMNMGFANYSQNCDSADKLYYAWDFCMPLSCSQPDLLHFFRGAISGYGLYSPVCSVSRLQDNARPFDFRTYIVLSIIGIVFFICLIASLYDAFILPSRSPLEPESFAISYLRSFSSYTIIGEILNTSLGKKPGQIPQLHCMRFFSMCWVILGHTMGAFLILVWNLSDVFDVLGSFGGQIIINAYYAVDTFFFQAGLLLSFLWFRAYKRNPKLVMSSSSWIMFYVHRILRLSPAYFMVIVFYTFVYEHYVVQFPLFFGLPGRLGTCRDKFWYNFLYINNIVGVEDPCYIVSWYLATDMQMYIFAPLLILPFTYSETVGVAWSLIVLALSTIANFLEIIIYRFPPTDFKNGWQDPKMTVPFTEYTRLVYNAAWIRCQVYIIGFLLGYFLQRTQKIRMNRVVNVAGWILCVGMAAAVIYPAREWSLGTPMAVGYRAIFSSLSRIGWGMILTWIIISCQSGYGGPINEFLSWDGWLPLGRLSYSAYLIHLMVAIQFMGFSQTGIVFTNLIQAFCIYTGPVILFTYLLSLLWSSTFEVPFAKLEALLTTQLLGIGHRGGGTSPQKQQTNIPSASAPKQQ
ncbi:Acyltransferase 3 domain-containing protein [Aphelenchoides bicaudatus]|nr:Acyltransferase 3 domain-containing protein [Aphelenchoides bicaudatus]